MPWKFDSDRPIWLQLEETVIRRIISGQYPAGGKLPSVRELASEAGANPNTVQRALSHLEETGLVTVQRNIGRLVTEDEALLSSTRRDLAQAELEAFYEKMRLLGIGSQELTAMLREKEEKNPCIHLSPAQG